MKRILKSPLAVLVYILIGFTIGAVVGYKISHDEFASWNIKSDREYIAFEVKRINKERPLIDMRIEQLIRAFEGFKYQVDKITILQDGKVVNIVLEEN